MAEFAPITVAGMLDGKLTVHDDRLHELLRREDVQKRPLVIISIAGAYRTGKSFMMNLFIRYLMRKGWENPNWFGEKESKVYGGTSHGRKLLPKPCFEWRNGAKRCTEGITICPEVFQIPLKDKRMAAVLLVDTQGLFDENSSMETNDMIMSLSLLLSSHQILNVKSDIDTRLYNHIELCISLAESTAKINNAERAKVFQNLTLLVRDFEHEYDFGDSKNGYLRDKLHTPSESKEVEKQKKAVKFAFDSLGCFLLPHPGKGVSKPGIAGVSNKDMDEEFRKFAKEFVESVFDPEKLQVKTIGENEVYSVDLLNVIGRAGKAFRNGEAPTSETFKKSAVHGINTKALEEAVSEYRKEMNNLFPETAMSSQEEMDAAHSEALTVAKSCFSSSARLGSEQDKEEYWEECKKECQSAFEKLEQSNQDRKKNKLWEIKSLMHSLDKRYTATMRQVGNEVTENMFEEQHKKHTTDILCEFDTATLSLQTAIPEIQNLRKTLQDEMASTHMGDKEQRGMEKSVATKAIKTAMNNALKLFNNAIEKFTESYQENLKGIVQKSKQNALALYNTETKNIKQQDTVKNYKHWLIPRFRALSDKAMRINGEKKKLLDEKYEAIGKVFGADLEQCLQKTLSQAHIKPSCFDSWVDVYLQEKVIPIIKDEPDWAQQKIRRVFMDKVGVVKEENRERAKFRSVFLKDIPKSVEQRSLLRVFGRGLGIFIKGAAIGVAQG